MKEYYFGTGRRKTSIAQVRVIRGTGKIIEKESGEAPNKNVINEANRVIDLLGLQGKYDISVLLRGGGVYSQADAVRLGLARAFSKINEQEYGTTLKKEGFLTRDPREKERKKPGLRRARRAPQWAKR